MVYKVSERRPKAEKSTGVTWTDFFDLISSDGCT